MAKKPLDGNAMVRKLLERSAVAGPEWQTNAAAAVEDAKAGAVAAANKWKTGVQAAITKNRFAAGVAQINTDETRAAIMATSADAVSTGLQKRQPKLIRRFTKLATLQTSARDRVNQLPSDTPEQRKAKMLANFDEGVKIGDEMRK
jgi:hypothetical protein